MAEAEANVAGRRYPDAAAGALPDADAPAADVPAADMPGGDVSGGEVSGAMALGDRPPSGSDIAALRRTIFADAHVSDAEIAAVGRLLDEHPEGGREWRHFLDDVYGDYFLGQAAPFGYFTDEGAALLAEMKRRDNRPGRLKTEVLVHLLSRCRTAPAALARLACERVEADVLSDGRIDRDDVELVRKLIYAAGGEGGLKVSRLEAELLFTLNEYSRAAENCPGWLDLFAKALACHVMVRHGYDAPDREEALRREAWLADTHVDVGGFMRRMVPSLLTAAGRRDRGSIWQGRNRDFAIGHRAADEISAGEARWLADRIGRDGTFCDAERAMIAYLDGLCEMDLPEVLAPFRDAA